MVLSEREALAFLKSATETTIRSDAPDLTARQLGILMNVALETGPHTVRGLAGTLDLSKPVVTRALDRLEALGFVIRIADERDLRSIFIERTAEGMAFLRAMVAPLAAPGGGHGAGRDGQKAQAA
ncbi:MAG: MarR family transcriptional regulator [Hyphomonadaceae bacterium]|nr:MarR family transcriptional regulator [Hyphomonadaceae bacterium]